MLLFFYVKHRVGDRLDMEGSSWEKGKAHDIIMMCLNENKDSSDNVVYQDLLRSAINVEKFEVQLLNISKTLNKEHFTNSEFDNLRSTIINETKNMYDILAMLAQNITSRVSGLILMDSVLDESFLKTNEYIVYKEECKDELNKMDGVLISSTDKFSNLLFGMIRKLSTDSSDNIKKALDAIVNATNSLAGLMVDNKSYERHSYIQRNKSEIDVKNEKKVITSKPSSPSTSYTPVKGLVLEHEIIGIFDELLSKWPTTQDGFSDCLKSTQKYINDTINIKDSFEINVSELKKDYAQLQKFRDNPRDFEDISELNNAIQESNKQLKTQLYESLIAYEGIIRVNINKLHGTNISHFNDIIAHTYDYWYKLLDILNQNNITIICPEAHQKFNHKEHIAHREKNKKFKEGTIISVARIGLKLPSTVIQAHVIVSSQ